MHTGRIFIVGIVLLLTPLAALAQTWDGGGSNDNITTAANWNPNGVPPNNGTADLLFGGSVRLTPKVNVDYDVDSVVFDNNSGAFNIGQLNNSTLFLRGGGITNVSGTPQTLSVPVEVSSAATSTQFFAFGGNLTFTEAFGLGTKSLSVGGALKTTIAAITGTGSITKFGGGVLDIQSSSSTNQYDLTVNAGTATFTTATFGSSATIAINGGEFLINNSFTLDGGQLTRANAASFRLINDSSTMTVQNAGEATFLGSFLLYQGLYRVTGAGSTFTYDGLEVASGSRLEVLAGAEVDITGAFFVGTNGAGAVLVDGPNSTLRLSNAAVLGSLIGGGQGSGGTLTFRNGATGDLGNDTVFVSGGSGSHGTFAVESGAQVTLGALVVAGSVGAEQIGTVTISGPGSRLTATSEVVGSEIGSAKTGNPINGSGIVNVENGGEVHLNSPLVIGETGALNITEGVFSMNVGDTITNNGTFIFNSGRLNLGENLSVGGGPSLLGVNVNLGTGRAVSVPSTHSTTVALPGVLVLDGGSLSTGSLVNNGGTFDFRRGTLDITGAAGLTIGPAGPLGAAVTVGAGQTLKVSNTATVQPGASLLLLTAGSFNAATVANNGSVTLDGANSTLAGGVVNNGGVLRGDGRVTAALNNLPAGEIRGEFGKTLQFSRATGPNAGRITIQNGTLQFSSPLTNSASGIISGRGTLFFDGGLTNAGKMQFSGGPTDIYGEVGFTGGAGGGEMINSGGANVVTFYGNIRHNGDEIRTSPTNTTVFFGDVSGAGPFTGTGAVRFEGTFMPGNSPATVTIEGDMQLGDDARIVMELSGSVAGDQYDQLQVGGRLFLDGTLAVSLLDSFAPRYGDTFDLFDFDAIAGRFDALRLPALDGGLDWDTTLLYTTGTITAVPDPAGWLLAVVGLAASMAFCRVRKQFANEFKLSTMSRNNAARPLRRGDL